MRVQSLPPTQFAARKPQSARTATPQVRFGGAQEASMMLLTLAGTGSLGIAGYFLTDMLSGGTIRGKHRAKELIKAIESGNTKKAERLLGKGVNPRQAMTSSSRIAGNNYVYPMHAALRAGNFELAQSMIDNHGYDVTQPRYGQFSSEPMSFMEDALYAGPDAVAFALKNGADSNGRSGISWCRNMTPVEMLALGFKFEKDDTLKSLEVLLDHGTNDDVARIIERMENEYDFGRPDPKHLAKYKADPEGGYAFVGEHLIAGQKPRTVAFLREYLASRPGKAPAV